MRKTAKFNSVFNKKFDKDLLPKELNLESINEEREPSPEPEPKKVEKAKKKVNFKE